jgi:hypothetical protein
MLQGRRFNLAAIYYRALGRVTQREVESSSRVVLWHMHVPRAATQCLGQMMLGVDWARINQSAFISASVLIALCLARTEGDDLGRLGAAKTLLRQSIEDLPAPLLVRGYSLPAAAPRVPPRANSANYLELAIIKRWPGSLLEPPPGLIATTARLPHA